MGAIINVPNEILTIILSLIDYSDLFNCRLVCKLWYYILTNNFTLRLYGDYHWPMINTYKFYEIMVQFEWGRISNFLKIRGKVLHTTSNTSKWATAILQPKYHARIWFCNLCMIQHISNNPIIFGFGICDQVKPDLSDSPVGYNINRIKRPDMNSSYCIYGNSEIVYTNNGISSVYSLSKIYFNNLSILIDFENKTARFYNDSWLLDKRRIDNINCVNLAVSLKNCSFIEVSSMNESLNILSAICSNESKGQLKLTRRNYPSRRYGSPVLSNSQEDS